MRADAAAPAPTFPESRIQRAYHNLLRPVQPPGERTTGAATASTWPPSAPAAYTRLEVPVDNPLLHNGSSLHTLALQRAGVQQPSDSAPAARNLQLRAGPCHGAAHS